MGGGALHWNLLSADLQRAFSCAFFFNTYAIKLLLLKKKIIMDARVFIYVALEIKTKFENIS